MGSAPGYELKNLLRRGEDALLRRDYERASTYFRRAYTSDPGNITAITNLGYTYAKMGRFSHAQKCFITALDIDPDNPIARKNLSLLMKPDKSTGRVVQGEGRGRSAEDLFLRYMEWGSLQMEQRNYYAAIQYYREASRIHPDFIEPYLNIGICYEELGEYDAALGAFSDALEIFPRDPVAQEHLDRCRGRREDEELTDPADSEMKPAVPRHPGRKIRTPDPGRQEPVKTGEPEIPAASGTGRSVRPGEPSHPAPAPPAASPPAAKTADDDMIKAILNQYSDLVSQDEPGGEAPDQKGEPDLQEGGEESVGGTSGYTPPTAKTAGPATSDDIVSSILLQYQEDLAGEEEGSGNGAETAEETQVPHTGHAPLSGGEDTTMTEKQGIRVELDDDQKDALRELGNIGASHAATTLSTILGTMISIKVPEIIVVQLNNLGSYIDDAVAAMVVFQIQGQVAGGGFIVLHIPRDSITKLTNIMLGQTTMDREIDDMDKSALHEVGNIMVSSFLDACATLLSVIMLPSPPSMVIDMPLAALQTIIANQEFEENLDQVVLFKTELQCSEHQIVANIILLPTRKLLGELFTRMDSLMTSSG